MTSVYIVLPYVVILACVFAILKFVEKYFDHSAGSVMWQVRNPRKVFVVDILLKHLWIPAVQELFFRVPLVIAFGAISLAAWYGIFAASIFLALVVS
jgi:predicted Abi (CAAX) family protease